MVICPKGVRKINRCTEALNCIHSKPHKRHKECDIAIIEPTPSGCPKCIDYFVYLMKVKKLRRKNDTRTKNKPS